MDVVFGTAGGDSVDKSFKVIRPSGSELSLQLHEGREKSWHKSPSWSPKGAIRRVVDTECQCRSHQAISFRWESHIQI